MGKIKYVCTKCSATGCRLWRQSHMFTEYIDLLCLDCAEKDQDKKKNRESDQIGMFVPAVPMEEGDTFWSYGCVPTDLVLWWYKLAERPIADTELLDYLEEILKPSASIDWREEADGTMVWWVVNMMREPISQECGSLREVLLAAMKLNEQNQD